MSRHFAGAVSEGLVVHKETRRLASELVVRAQSKNLPRNRIKQQGRMDYRAKAARRPSLFPTFVGADQSLGDNARAGALQLTR